MASVPFTLVPPDAEGLVKLHVLEAPAKDGPYVEIDVVMPVGDYPGYIDSYTTDAAASADDWFVVQWEDSKGALSDYSAAVKGGTTSLVDAVASRVRERDPSLDWRVVVQEAEAAIQVYLGDDQDPYALDPSSVSYRHLTGLVYLAMARSYLSSMAGGSAQSATIGLVSLKGASAGTAPDVQRLADLAADALGLNLSVVLRLAPPCCHRCRVWTTTP